MWEKVYNTIHVLNKTPPHELHADQCWKQLQRDKWYTTKPVLGYQRESYSDIERRVTNYGC